MLYILLETLRHLARMLWPFLPETSEGILERLGVLEEEKAAVSAQRKVWGLLAPGTTVHKGGILFPRKGV